MGTQHIHITQSKLQYKHSGFRRLFAWYFLGILSTAFLLTCILELVCVFLVALIVQDTSIFAHNRPPQILVILLLVALPFMVLVIAILFFARLLTCSYQQHVLSLVLSDTGCGIAPEDLPHIFEKFYQGRTQPDDKTRKAAGLGLYTCKRLVEMQGGTITIHSHPASGCEVTICVPIGSAADLPKQR